VTSSPADQPAASAALADPQVAPAPPAEPDRPLRSVALLTCPDMPDGGGDTLALRQACSARGIDLVPVVWSRPGVRWATFDAILPLYVWDYANRPSSFRAWLHEREVEGVRLLNSGQLIRFALDKARLLELAERGVPMPETYLRPAGSRSAGPWPASAAIVAKPRHGYGARGLELMSPVEWQPPAHDMLVQAYEPCVTERGEIAVICLDGTPVACVRKTPAEGDFRTQEEWGGRTDAEPLSDAAEQAALRVLAELPEMPLYARLDFFDPEDGPFRLVEVELFEPDLYLRLHDGAPAAFADALRRRLDAGVGTLTA
jgi:hypothetical protein